MHPDDEPQLRAAFAELHRRQREQVPPFAPMREQAMRNADDRRPSSREWPGMQRIGWAALAFSLAAMAMWRIERVPERKPPNVSAADTRERVHQLITTIERHLESDAEAISSPDYPTDILLAGTESDLSR